MAINEGHNLRVNKSDNVVDGGRESVVCTQMWCGCLVGGSRLPSADECLDLGGAAPETDFAPPPRDPLILTVPRPAPATLLNFTETHFRDNPEDYLTEDLKPCKPM